MFLDACHKKVETSTKFDVKFYNCEKSVYENSQLTGKLLDLPNVVEVTTKKNNFYPHDTSVTIRVECGYNTKPNLL